ncbi:MAG: MMPL family transporter, partial [Spirochaetales bacterium]|nr:MMPL family transporter [Spirochaetales bacterium]
DYAIHLMTGYVQERYQGKDFIPALESAFQKSGKGVITGALTTAAAFYALLLAESDIVRELAVLAGTGILCELLAMLMLIPAFLGWRQRRLAKKGKPDPMLTRKTRIRSDFADGLGKRITSRPGLWMAALLTIGLLLGTQAPKVELEDNLMNMEAEGLESVELQDVMTDEFGTAPDVLYVIAESREELPEMVQKLKKLDSVKEVSAITQWWPTEAQRQERLPSLENMQTRQELWSTSGESDAWLVQEELFRLEANLVEMGDMAVLGGTDRLAFILNRITGLDNDGNKTAESVFDRIFDIMDSEDFDESALVSFQNSFSPLLSDRILHMASSEQVGLEDLPPMIKDSFLSVEDASTLVSISPRMNPWEGQFRNIFTAQVGTVTDRATGMILAADQMTQIADSDGKRAMMAALIAVFIILLFDFRNFKLTALTFVPLLLSFASLYGLMSLFGIKFDFVNIISIPLLVGIGIDDSVHINHRYLLEGKGEMHTALARTGSAVALTTMTTMIGFASFIPSIMRAMRSTGIVLTLAMALAFLFSICFHPAVLVLANEKWGWNLTSWTSRKSRKEGQDGQDGPVNE